ncbi:MAG: FtsK/SpoIIIE domain-containing protein [Alphaproteobacteria bacterium]|nr:FtsK/SpoIIIE domain-containing protein [Alphaproteobacteria bacterium]
MANSNRLSATELTCAVLDPDWRAKWLKGASPSTNAFAPPGTPRVMGVEFHREVERLVRWLTDAESVEAAAKLDSADALVEHVWTTSLEKRTTKLFDLGRGEDAERFTARMRNFCARLIELKARTANFENWQDVFVAAEQAVRVSVRLEDIVVELGGRVDAIRFHPSRGLEVVDYKLTGGERQKSDLVQLAIYGQMLPLWRPGCGFCGTLEYYLPEFQEVAVEEGELRDIFAGLVAPVLREMFGPRPMRRPAAGTGKGPASATPVVGKSTTDYSALERAVIEAFLDFKLKVEAAGVTEGPQLLRLRLIPGKGVKVSSLASRAEDLQVALKLGEPPLIKAGKGFVTLDLPRPEPQVCLLGPLLAGPLGAQLKSPVAFVVGLDIEGAPVVADFAEPNTCHALVAGSTGSGKSEWLKAMLASMLLRSRPEQMKIALIDPKILTFAGVADSPFLWRPVATTLEEALAILRDAVVEMDARFQTMAGEGFTSLGDRIKAGRQDLPYLVLVFDEFADLILGSSDGRKTFEELVSRIAGKGRAAGIHLVLATQRPDARVVTGLIKANLPLRVCLKVANSTNAQIVLDETGAESLFGKGDLLCDAGKSPVRAQGLFIPQAEFVAALKTR